MNTIPKSVMYIIPTELLGKLPENLEYGCEIDDYDLNREEILDYMRRQGVIRGEM